VNIRRAEINDINGINKLLCQVLEVHHAGRPDIFKGNTKKYTDGELADIIKDDKMPVFVATDENDNIMGYAFCIFKQHKSSNILTDIKTLYIDDLCVDADMRKKHIGKTLYDYVLDFAKSEGCYNVTLNVWACNEGAIKFYEKCGLSVLKTELEAIL